MGYTHYWYRPLEIQPEIMSKIAADFSKLVPVLREHGIALAGGLGTGKANISSNGVVFNGVENCGHEHQELGIAWPAEEAGGASTTAEVTGSWFAGAKLLTRSCGGDCSHETLAFRSNMGKPYLSEDKHNPGLYFDCCKTAFKPYDIAVTAFLIIAKHHLQDRLIVSSDGEDIHWFDGQMLCQSVLDYGLQYNLGALGKKEK